MAVVTIRAMEAAAKTVSLLTSLSAAKSMVARLGLVTQFGYEDRGKNRTQQLEIHFRPAFQLSIFLQ